MSDGEGDDQRRGVAARQSPGNRTLDTALALRLANHVRVGRGRIGLSQEALAQAAGVSTLQVVRIESGHANPTLATLAGLAEALDVPVTALLA